MTHSKSSKKSKDSAPLVHPVRETNSLSISWSGLQSDQTFSETELHNVLDEMILRAKNNHQPLENALWGEPLMVSQKHESLLINVMKESALSESNKIIIAGLLLKAGVNIHDCSLDESQSNALHLACDQGSRRLALFLLEQGADSLSTDAQGMTPLHLATRKSNAPLICDLLKHPFNLDAQNQWGRSVLHIVSSYPWLELMNIFLSHPMNVHLPDFGTGDTPLHLAVISESTKAVDLLLAHGAYCEVFNQAGDTPLLLALKNNQQEIAEHLVSAGASLTTKGPAGKTVLQVLQQARSWIDVESIAKLERLEIERIVTLERLELDRMTKDNRSAKSSAEPSALRL